MVLADRLPGFHREFVEALQGFQKAKPTAFGFKDGDHSKLTDARKVARQVDHPPFEIQELDRPKKAVEGHFT